MAGEPAILVYVAGRDSAYCNCAGARSLHSLHCQMTLGACHWSCFWPLQHTKSALVIEINITDMIADAQAAKQEASSAVEKLAGVQQQLKDLEQKVSAASQSEASAKSEVDKVGQLSCYAWLPTKETDRVILISNVACMNRSQRDLAGQSLLTFLSWAAGRSCRGAWCCLPCNSMNQCTTCTSALTCF